MAEKLNYLEVYDMYQSGFEPSYFEVSTSGELPQVVNPDKIKKSSCPLRHVLKSVGQSCSEECLDSENNPLCPASSNETLFPVSDPQSDENLGSVPPLNMLAQLQNIRIFGENNHVIAVETADKFLNVLK